MGYETEADPHTIEVHIGRIRERLKDNPNFEIVTMRGIGYKAVSYTHLDVYKRQHSTMQPPAISVSSFFVIVLPA